jgi:hypothetical protein
MATNAERASRLAALKKGKGKPVKGFKNVASQIAAKQGIPLAKARAILASKTRGASAKEKRANPRLNNVLG